MSSIKPPGSIPRGLYCGICTISNLLGAYVGLHIDSSPLLGFTNALLTLLNYLYPIFCYAYLRFNLEVPPPFIVRFINLPSKDWAKLITTPPQPHRTTERPAALPIDSDSS